MAGRLLLHRVHGNPNRPAVLLVHGFLGCKEDWQEVASALASTHFVIAVDLPGHGESIEGFSAPDYVMAGCTDLLTALLDSLGIGACTLIGYSMGGRLALNFAVQYPERCNALVLESASPGLRTEQERQARRIHDNALAERLLAEPFDRFLDDWYAQPLFEPLRMSAGFGELVERRRRNNPRGLALSLRNMGTGAQPSLWSSLAAVTLPVLSVTGGLDTKFTRIAHEMADLFPRCETAVIDSAGHTLHFEAPARYIAAVQQFLKERK